MESIYNKNYKRILCKNVLDTGKCNRQTSCYFAHSIHEQTMTPEREFAYNLLLSQKKRYNIPENLNIRELYLNLLSLTQRCEDCINNRCKGGKNCSYGSAFDKYFCICNVKNGSCTSCKNIHITEFGLSPISDIANNVEYLYGKQISDINLFRSPCIADYITIFDMLQVV